MDKKINPKNERQLLQNDWNFKFIKNPTEKTILEFKLFALKTFEENIGECLSANDQEIKIIEKNGLVIGVVEGMSQKGRILKNEWRNYHYILSSLNEAGEDLFIGVPMAIIIEYMGIIALVKSTYPKEA